MQNTLCLKQIISEQDDIIVDKEKYKHNKRTQVNYNSTKAYRFP